MEELIVSNGGKATGSVSKKTDYPVEELRFKRKRRFDKVRIDDDKELKALEELERKEGKAHISDD